jgi:hypothetical protein
MTQPPELTHQVVSSEEMRKLAREHGIESQIADLTPQKTRQPQSEDHEAFCCKKDLLLFVDGNDDELAIIIEQIYSDKSRDITRTFTQIRVGSTVYRLRIP